MDLLLSFWKELKKNIFYAKKSELFGFGERHIRLSVLWSRNIRASSIHHFLNAASGLKTSSSFCSLYGLHGLATSTVEVVVVMAKGFHICLEAIPRDLYRQHCCFLFFCFPPYMRRVAPFEPLEVDFLSPPCQFDVAVVLRLCLLHLWKNPPPGGNGFDHIFWEDKSEFRTRDNNSKQLFSM